MVEKSTRTLKEDTQIALMAQDLKYLRSDMIDIKMQLSSGYVPLARYILVERIVYGMVGLILVAVVGALLSQIVR